PPRPRCGAWYPKPTRNSRRASSGWRSKGTAGAGWSVVEARLRRPTTASRRPGVSMGRYLLQRTIGMVLMLILISIVSYSMVRLLPAARVIGILGGGGDPVGRARVGAALGLDQPAALYYFVWVGRVLPGDFGRSIQSNKPVLETLREKLVPTVELTVM